MSVLSPANYEQGRVVLAAPANPAAGATPVITVPAGRIWRPRSLSAVLTTSAAAGTRLPWVDARDGGGVVYHRAPQLNGLGPSNAALFSWALSSEVTSGGTLNLQAGFGDVLMLGGHDLVLQCLGLNVADQWSAIRFLYEEWLV